MANNLYVVLLFSSGKSREGDEQTNERQAHATGDQIDNYFPDLFHRIRIIN